MSAFVNRDVFNSVHDDCSKRRETARSALQGITESEHRRPFTSSYVYATDTLTRSRTASFEAVQGVGDRRRGRRNYRDICDFFGRNRLPFDAAVETFEQYGDQSLSVAELRTGALVERHDIDRVLSYDDDIDGVVRRKRPREP